MTHSVAQVRTEMLPELPPPPNTVGPIGWLRNNLFSDWKSTLLTLVSIWFIYKILAAIIPWAVFSVWDADSLSQCREIFLERYGPDFEGACWAVIKDRWHQLIFGFYPQDAYWRPIVAFIIMIVALIPILYENTSRKLFIVTAIAPFAFPWLLWGGTIWTPILAALGFVIGYYVNKFVSDAGYGLLGTVLAVLAAVIWWLFLLGAVASALHSIIPIDLPAVKSLDFGGFLLSITIGIVAIVASLPIGIVLALGRQSDLLIVRSLCIGFIEIIRGVPLITLLFIASVLLNYFLPRGTNFDIIVRVMILVTLFTAAYMAEVIRGGLAALPKGQYEAGDALGLTYWQSQRLVIMPQALKISIPGIVSNFISVFKDTTLVIIIALNDPLGIANTIRSVSDWNGIVWELYGFIAIVFFIFCFSMSRYSMYLERKLQTGHR